MIIETKIFYYVEGSNIQQKGKWIKADIGGGYRTSAEAFEREQEYKEVLKEIGQHEFGWTGFRVVKETQQITKEVIEKHLVD